MLNVNKHPSKHYINTLIHVGSGIEDQQAIPLQANAPVRVGEHSSVSLPPPKPFDGTPASWPKWKQRFDRYRTGSGLSLKSRDEQVGVFLYTMGDVADDILSTLKINEDDQGTTYTTLSTAFDTHFNL